MPDPDRNREPSGSFVEGGFSGLLSERRVRKLVEQYFGDLGPDVVDLMVEIARKESSFNAVAEGDNFKVEGATRDPLARYDYGLFQVNQQHGFDPEKLQNATYNVWAARQVYDQQGPTAWTTFSDAASESGYVGPETGNRNVQTLPKVDDLVAELFPDVSKLDPNYPLLRLSVAAQLSRRELINAPPEALRDELRSTFGIVRPEDVPPGEASPPPPTPEEAIESIFTTDPNLPGKLVNKYTGDVYDPGRENLDNLIKSYEALYAQGSAERANRGLDLQGEQEERLRTQGEAGLDIERGRESRLGGEFQQTLGFNREEAGRLARQFAEEMGFNYAQLAENARQFGVTEERLNQQLAQQAQQHNEQLTFDQEKAERDFELQRADIIGTQEQEAAEFVRDTFREPADVLSRLFTTRGLTSPAGTLTQADIANDVRSRLEGTRARLDAMPGFTRPGGGALGRAPGGPIFTGPGAPGNSRLGAPGAELSNPNIAGYSPVTDPNTRGYYSGQHADTVSRLYPDANAEQAENSAVMLANLLKGEQIGTTAGVLAGDSPVARIFREAGVSSTPVPSNPQQDAAIAAAGGQPTSPGAVLAQVPQQPAAAPASQPAPVPQVSLEDAIANAPQAISGGTDFGAALQSYAPQPTQQAPVPQQSSFVAPQPGNAAVDELMARMIAGGAKGFAEGGVSDSRLAVVGERGPELAYDMPGQGFVVLNQEQLGFNPTRLLGDVQGAQGGGIFGQDTLPYFRDDEAPAPSPSTGGGSRRLLQGGLGGGAGDFLRGATGYGTGGPPITQEEIIGAARESTPPAFQALLEGKQPPRFRAGLPLLPTAQGVSRLTSDELTASRPRLAAEFNIELEDMLQEIMNRFGRPSTAGRSRLFVR